MQQADRSVEGVKADSTQQDFGSWKNLFCVEFTCWPHQLPPTVQTLVSEVDCTLELPVQ